MLTSADWLRTKALVSGSDPRPGCSRAQDGTAINHELPSWAKRASAESLDILCEAGKLHLSCCSLVGWLSAKQQKEIPLKTLSLCQHTRIFSGPSVLFMDFFLKLAVHCE